MEHYTLIIAVLDGTVVYTDLTRGQVEEQVASWQGSRQRAAVTLEQAMDGEAMACGDYMVIPGKPLKAGVWRRASHQFHGWAKNTVASFRVGNYTLIPGSIDRMSPQEAEQWHCWLQQVKQKMDNAQSALRSIRAF